MTSGPQYNPLPQLDYLSDTALPFYDLSENMQADDDVFYKNLSYVADTEAA